MGSSQDDPGRQRRLRPMTASASAVLSGTLALSGAARPALVCLVVATVVMMSLIATVAVGAAFARRSSTRAAAAHTLEALLHLIPWYRRD